MSILRILIIICAASISGCISIDAVHVIDETRGNISAKEHGESKTEKTGWKWFGIVIGPIIPIPIPLMIPYGQESKTTWTDGKQYYIEETKTVASGHGCFLLFVCHRDYTWGAIFFDELQLH